MSSANWDAMFVTPVRSVTLSVRRRYDRFGLNSSFEAADSATRLIVSNVDRTVQCISVILVSGDRALHQRKYISLLRT